MPGNAPPDLILCADGWPAKGVSAPPVALPFPDCSVPTLTVDRNDRADLAIYLALPNPDHKFVACPDGSFAARYSDQWIITSTANGDVKGFAYQGDYWEQRMNGQRSDGVPMGSWSWSCGDQRDELFCPCHDASGGFEGGFRSGSWSWTDPAGWKITAQFTEGELDGQATETSGFGQPTVCSTSGHYVFGGKEGLWETECTDVASGEVTVERSNWVGGEETRL